MTARTKTRLGPLLSLLALGAVVWAFTVGPLNPYEMLGPRAVELEAFWNPGQNATVTWVIDAEGNTEAPSSSGHFYQYRHEWLGSALLDVAGEGYHALGVTCILRSNGHELTRAGDDAHINHCHLSWPRGR